MILNGAYLMNMCLTFVFHKTHIMVCTLSLMGEMF